MSASRRTSGHWKTWLAMTICAGFGLLCAGQASAGTDFYVNVHNDSPYSLKLLGGGTDCWYPDDLADGAAPAIAPGTSRVIHSESKNTSFTSCFDAAKSQNLEISFQRKGSYPGPFN